MTGVKGLTNPSNMRDCESGNLFDIMVTLMHHANSTKSIYLSDVGISIVLFEFLWIKMRRRSFEMIEKRKEVNSIKKSKRN